MDRDSDGNMVAHYTIDGRRTNFEARLSESEVKSGKKDLSYDEVKDRLREATRYLGDKENKLDDIFENMHKQDGYILSKEQESAIKKNYRCVAAVADDKTCFLEYQPDWEEYDNAYSEERFPIGDQSIWAIYDRKTGKVTQSG